MSRLNHRLQLMSHVQNMERLDAAKVAASEDFKAALDRAKAEGYDPTTLRIVLKLRKMTPDQRRERRALEAIYMAALGMLDGDSLPDEARRRLDAPQEEAPREAPKSDRKQEDSAALPPEQPPLIVKDPEEARKEGAEAARVGKRVYDNPYRAGDPCRAAWDEGWCAQQKSNGMETPAAYQRRNTKPPDDKRDKDAGAGSGDTERGAA